MSILFTRPADPTWMDEAICPTVDPAIFHPDADGKHPAETVAQAKQVCTGCPVRRQCLTYAIEHAEYGVWGATSDGDRKRLRPSRAA